MRNLPPRSLVMKLIRSSMSSSDLLGNCVSIPRLARSLKIDPAPGTLGATASAEALVRRDCSSPPSQATSLHAIC
jgi:hypothetical protein